MSLSDPKKIGKYEVVAVLGRGGMGVVYKALDPVIGRTVAIKMLTGEFTDNADLLQRFYREAQSAGVLQHPNIVTIYDLGEIDGKPFIAMEHLEGQTLDAIIQHGPQLTLLQTLDIIGQVLGGLGYAHKHGVVHRDVKPNNVMVLPDGACKLVDFGIARVEDKSVTRTGEIMGTISYMSPEQVNAHVVDGRTDIWSTGVMFYRLLTGVMPFEAPNMPATMMKILNEPPPPLEKYLGNYPPELDDILKLCLAKNRDERYESAQVFASDLLQLQERHKDRLIDDQLVHARKILASGKNLDQAKSSILQVLRLDRNCLAAKALLEDVRKDLLAEVAEQEKTTAEGLEEKDRRSPAIEGTVVDSRTMIAGGVPSEVLNQDRANSSASASPIPPVGHTRIFGTEQDLPRVRLTCTASDDLLSMGRSVTIDKVPFSIGRDSNCDWTLPDQNLSRQHAMIESDGGAFLVSDLGSRNGTYLNGRRLAARHEVLPFGAVIRLGRSTVLTFSSEDIAELPELTGQLLGDRYKLVKLLRKGAKTALYEASDLRLPQQVAVKILSPTFATYPGYLDHLKREAEMAARLRHPHICRILDYGQASVPTANALTRLNYLCMELMEGGSLAECLSKEEHTDLPWLMRWIDDVCDALDHSHREGFVHGGLKLSSIVFSKEGKAYVTDFAMSSRAQDEARTVFLASPEFLAPEVWEGSAGGPPADQYSLAAIVYLLLTGALPFEGQLDPNVRQRNLERGPIAAHEEAARNGRPGLPDSVSEVLKRALSVNPEARYPTLHEFFLALQYAVAHPKRQRGRPRAFISYKRDEGSAWAMLFARELDQKHQIDSFLDTQRLDTAPILFPVRLRKEIEECDVFVCFLSENTLSSKWVHEEIRLAFNSNKSMIPIFQEGFVHPQPADNVEPYVQTLLTYEGVPLMDQRNIFVYEAIARLATIVKASNRSTL